MHRILATIFLASVTQAEGLLVNFGEGNLNLNYRHQTYIQNGKYVHIDDHFKWDETGENVVPHMPNIYSVSLSSARQNELVAKLIELGVDDWKSSSPGDSADILCHGLGYELYIKSESLNVQSSGSCQLPNNYQEVVNVFKSIHESPNK